MSYVEWIARAADEVHSPEGPPLDAAQVTRESAGAGGLPLPGVGLAAADLQAYAEIAASDMEGEEDSWEIERARRIYRGRTVAMLRRYMRYSIETGRLPSLLGREFFRAKVTSYTVVTFEDRVIFVHDMERCLEKLDEFSRQLIARHILQEHDQAATGHLLNCTERTVRTWVPIALDLLSEILLQVGLLDGVGTKSRKSCQGGKMGESCVSRCERGKNNF